jgi:hypothetical protein
MLRYATVLYSTLLHILYSTLPLPVVVRLLSCFSTSSPAHSIKTSELVLFYWSLLHSSPLHSSPLHSTILYSPVLSSTLLYSTTYYFALFTIAYSTLLYLTLHYSTLFWIYSISRYSWIYLTILLQMSEMFQVSKWIHFDHPRMDDIADHPVPMDVVFDFQTW